jgi:hypothetical protein
MLLLMSCKACQCCLALQQLLADALAAGVFARESLLTLSCCVGIPVLQVLTGTGVVG